MMDPSDDEVTAEQEVMVGKPLIHMKVAHWSGLSDV
jgi:hypothetical protein